LNNLNEIKNTKNKNCNFKPAIKQHKIIEMFHYSTNVKSRTTYEIGVSFGKPDYTKVVKHATATYHNFEIDEVLIRTGERIIYVYDPETLFLSEYRRYSESGTLIEKARNFHYSIDNQPKGCFIVSPFIEVRGKIFTYFSDTSELGRLDTNKNKFYYSSYHADPFYSLIKFEIDDNQNVFREYYYIKEKSELSLVLEHQYDLLDLETASVDYSQSKLASLITRMERINQLMLSQDELEFLRHNFK